MYNAEKEKTGYLLKLYLRIRLRKVLCKNMKIQTYCFYLAKSPATADKLLSNKERNFLEKYARMKYQYFSDNVMSLLHKNYRGLAGMEVVFE